MHHRDANLAVIVDELASKRICKSGDSVLGGAIRRLQWDAAIGEGRADLHNHASVARQHSLERTECTVHHAEVSYFGDAFVLLRFHLLHRRKHGCHRVVYPDVDGAELLLNRGGCLFHCVRICHIGGQNQSLPPRRFNLSLRAFQTFDSARQQTYAGAMASEITGNRTAQPSRCSGDNHDLVFH
jgi:hypothetical protein